MAKKNISQSPAHNADRGARVVRSRRADGTVVQENVPWGDFEMWVSKAGNVQSVKMSTHPVVRKFHDYRARIREAKEQAGAIPYAECPLRNGLVSQEAFPERLQGAPCDPKSMSAQQCCPHVSFVIDLRRAKRAEETRRRELRRMSAEERRLRLQEEQNQLLRQQAGLEATATDGQATGSAPAASELAAEATPAHAEPATEGQPAEDAGDTSIDDILVDPDAEEQGESSKSSTAKKGKGGKR